MKIIIRTIYDKYEFEYYNNVSTNIIIEDISKKEIINKHDIVLLYKNFVIKYMKNELELNNTTTLFMLISPINV